MRLKLPHHFMLWILTLLPVWAMAQISGRATLGTHPSQPSTQGLEGITVKAYHTNPETGNQELLTQTLTNTYGEYQLDVPADRSVRLVFGNAGASLQSSPSTPSVRFVRSPQSAVNWNVYNPTLAIPDNPWLAAPVYISGMAQDTSAALKALSVDSTRSVTLATAKQVGALWAVAYDATSGQLYSAAFAKRHVGFGPLGTGGIYRTDWTTKKTVPYLDLKQLGIATGNDRHQGLNADSSGRSADPLLMQDVGKQSLGGMDLSQDGKTLYVVNLSDRKLYAIALPADTAARPAQSDVTSFTLPKSTCSGGENRPFAVKVHQGKVYVGSVCDAQSSQRLSDLTATVYRLNPESGRFSEVISLPLDYTRGRAVTGIDLQGWFPWTDDFSLALHSSFPSTAVRPQPILASIAFDVEGGMVLGFMDRFGHQSGTGQLAPDGLSAYSGIAAGDVLRVYPKKGNPNTADKIRYRLEANAQAGKLSTEGSGNRQGPAGGEFYFQDSFEPSSDNATRSRIVHEETGAGALAFLPSTGELLMTAHEPTSEFNAGGVKAFSESGRNNRGWLFYTNAQPGTFGKANGVGGMAFITPAAGIVIGNRVWSDDNGDGLQDPQEAALSGVKVELWKGEALLATTHTDAEGQYAFDGSNVANGLRPATDYQLRIPLKENGFKVSRAKTGSDVEIDNDATENNGNAIINLTTGNAGETRHGYDFGLLPPVENKPSGTVEREFAELIIYPNPVVERVEVSQKASEKQALLHLTDMQGKVLVSQSLQERGGYYKTTVRMSKFPAGNYIISIDEKGVKRTGTILKR